jgi:peptide/nickel transport system permease protein
VFARLAHAVGLSLRLAMLCVLSSVIPGTVLGMLATWRGGWTDRLLVTLADIVQALPGLLLVLLLAAFAPGELWPLYIGVALVLWVEYFRVVRAMSHSLLASPQAEASQLLGFGAAYIVKRHLLPELLPVVGTLMSFGAATAVLALSGTGFIGVGLQPPTPELGLMMIELLPYYDEAPWLIGAPIGILTIFLLGLVLLAGNKDPR